MRYSTCAAATGCAAILLLTHLITGQVLSQNMGEQMSARADKLDYDRSAGIVEGKGNVVIRRGDDELRADHVRIDTRTHDAVAMGNVILVRPVGVWRGERLAYNFKTRVASCDKFTVDIAPFHIAAKAMPTAAADKYVVQNAVVTTCTNPLHRAHWRASASTLEVVPGKYFEARNSILYLGPVPVFYLPYWYRNLREDLGYRVYPGYSSEMGAFLLNTVRYRLTPVLRGETSIDVRSRRGLAGGQTFKWNDPEGAWVGELRGYYARDNEPMNEDDYPALCEIPSNRYRFFARHSESFSPNDYVILQGEYASDVDFREDFFENEFREQRYPENYAVYTRRDNSLAFNAIARARLNDFYPSVNRLPELSVEFARQQIVDSPVYYEGKTAVAFLERVKPDNPPPKPEEEYSTFRFDSDHTVLYPGYYFGFLSIIPRAGYRATYYSKTQKEEAFITTRSGIMTNQQIDAYGHTNTVLTPFTEIFTSTNKVNAGAKLRNIFEVGMELSYRAFAVWDTGGVPTRHVVEPYANYTLRPEPSLDLKEIWQFDEVDKLGEEHKMRLGTRNRWQIKDGDRAHDIADVDFYTVLRFHRDNKDPLIRDVMTEGEITPANGVYLRFDASLNIDEGALETFNLRTELTPGDWLELASEYRFRKNDSGLFSMDATMSPNVIWAFNGYGRYNLDDSRLEEIGGYAEKSLDCLAFRLGVGFVPGYTTEAGRKRDDETRVIFGMWLTAFPQGKAMGRYTK